MVQQYDKFINKCLKINCFVGLLTVGFGMAKPEHIALARKGMIAIEKWSGENPENRLELSGADLRKINLSRANLFYANLSTANLSGAHLSESDLTLANLEGANLKKARLSFSSLVATKLGATDLSESFLIGTRFQYPDLLKTVFTGAEMFRAVFCDCDLAKCIGLSTVKHIGPSTIGIDTLIRSFKGAGNRFSGEMETFFLNAGVPKQLIDALPGALAKIQYFTCFLAYGESDRAFAERLNKGLIAKGVSSWFYPWNALPGESMWREISQKRREQEKMIVLCSAEGLVRDGLLKEIEEQIDEDPEKIVPVSLDNTWKQKGFVVRRGQREDLKTFLLSRNYVEFSDESKYNESFGKLLAGIERK